ncbi:oxidoreductase [Paenibacillus alvei]|uniref:oxidoreductase n=1 Tax=Paenibacillus alvei TaxID=44250 RepID=UPI0018CFBDA4|nr:oxidoreductase [Paenibacillus alvei]MBG9733464.1 oxidoreductase [Paenibacillus alvei]MBG9742681.1 oxidoreductase [Paenibacillus alvei]MCY9581500.1 oxidoreductase [Paenibacillus alvei]MCY9585493.1 oxidoreductase [Paenibacillus alvei]
MKLNGKRALIAGASGLIGRELLNILLQSDTYDQVYAMVRRPLETKHPKLTEIVCSFDQLEQVAEQLAVDDVFCCLGTTIKKAKSKEAMYQVDVHYPTSLAKLSKEQGARHFLVVSSMNANMKSPFWYARMKGMLEEQLQHVSFEALSIFRPSLLLGERHESRLLEDLSSKVIRSLFSLLGRPIPSRLAIEAKVVALAMFHVANEKRVGVAIYSSNQIEAIASSTSITFRNN